MTDSTDNARGPERIVWDAMVWAAQQPAPRYGAAYPSYTDRGNSDAEIKCRDTVARIRADLAPDPLGAVKVKPLVWCESYGVWRAETPFGDYKVAGKLLTLPLPLNPQQIHNDSEAAKAAAQQDYEQRICSALEPDPQDDARVVPDLPSESDELSTMVSDLSHTGDLSMLYRCSIADAITALRVENAQLRAAFDKGGKDE